MKTMVDFISDLHEAQELLLSFNKRTDSHYELVEQNKRENPENDQRIKVILEKLKLEDNQENRLALITRLCALRDDSLKIVLKKSDRSEAEINEAWDIVYEWVAEYYLDLHQEYISELEKRQLFTPFYREIFRAFHRIGRIMTILHPIWTNYIINGVNRKLEASFADEKAVSRFLASKDLFDRGHDNKPGDRCYSALIPGEKEGEWSAGAYGTIFADEVNGIIHELDNLSDILQREKDDIFREKTAWLDYVGALRQAFAEKNVHQLIKRWADVERFWMGITGPVQPGHPMEYYEDHYRKAVALEWDIRMSNPEHATKGHRLERIISMVNKFFHKHGENKPAGFQKTVDFSLEKLNSIQLHIGRAAVYYGADLCGLFSAQVVPNDEIVSREYGKKVFAFPDNVRESQQSRPFVKLSSIVFDREFLTEQRTILFQEKELWFRLYDVSTIGHEYGHVLWVDDDSEAVMNDSGCYKNVEEWKATTGGLLTFFMSDDAGEQEPNFRRLVVGDLLQRAVRLLAWKESSEVQAYYVEGLIHLQGLFKSGILSFSDKLIIDTSVEKVEKLAIWYEETYRRLVFDYYLPKIDPAGFLKDFIEKSGRFYVPVMPELKRFADWYTEQNKLYGREVDDSDCRENYL
jgi:hypothetical protein